MKPGSNVEGVVGALIFVAYLVALGVYVGRRYDGFIRQQVDVANRLFLLEHPELHDSERSNNG